MSLRPPVLLILQSFFFLFIQLFVNIWNGIRFQIITSNPFLPSELHILSPIPNGCPNYYLCQRIYLRWPFMYLKNAKYLQCTQFEQLRKGSLVHFLLFYVIFRLRFTKWSNVPYVIQICYIYSNLLILHGNMTSTHLAG